MIEVAQIKKIIKLLLVFTVALAMALPSVVAAAEAGKGDDGLVTLEVTVNGPTAAQADLEVQKEIDGIWESFYPESVVAKIATFKVPIGGSCMIYPSPVSGYDIPDPVSVPLSKIRGNMVVSEEITYDESTLYVDVDEITLDQTSLTLLEGETATLIATVAPSNADNKVVNWTSTNPAAATVNTNGLVTAIGMGEAIIRAESDDNDTIFAECDVDVGEIDFDTVSVTPDSIAASVGEVINLPTSVSADVQYGSGALDTIDLAVSWEGVGPSNTITYSAAGTYLLDGTVLGELIGDLLEIVVSGAPILLATDVTLNESSIDLHHNDTFQLEIVSVTPPGASLSAVMWRSSNEAVATVDVSGLVTADDDTSGEAIIEVYYEDGGLVTVMDRCWVSVSVDPNITEAHYIMAVESGSTVEAEIFAEGEDVYVYCYGLEDAETYQIKLEEKGSKVPLGTGSVKILNNAEGEFEFNLWDKLIKNSNRSEGFDLTSKNSKTYYLSMSKNPEFPSGDDNDIPATFVDNFKITSPIPTGYINLTLYADDPSVLAAFVNQDIILARVINETDDSENVYEKYLNDTITYPYLPKYSDEVKMTGTIVAGGLVEWDEPKEQLKIGGYVVLIEVPEGYGTNLENINPASEDGELLKEVHITRNNTVIRNIYVFEVD